MDCSRLCGFTVESTLLYSSIFCHKNPGFLILYGFYTDFYSHDHIFSKARRYFFTREKTRILYGFLPARSIFSLKIALIPGCWFFPTFNSEARHRVLELYKIVHVATLYHRIRENSRPDRNGLKLKKYHLQRRVGYNHAHAPHIGIFLKLTTIRLFTNDLCTVPP